MRFNSLTRLWAIGFAAILLPTLIVMSGCHSYHVETTVENRTGQAIQQLEVDYPSASFGVDSLAPGAMFHYRIQLRGTGTIKVLYPGAIGHQVSIDGPSVAERQEGSLQIVLLPGGKADFQPHLTPVR